MAEPNTGGMFSKLMNPDTAQPRTEASPSVIPHEAIKPVIHSSIPTAKKQPKEVKAPLPEPKNLPRKQISAYLSREQLQLLKQLYFKLNSGDAEIEKSEIVGLAVEVLSQLLSTKVPRYSSTNKIREYLNTQISRYLSTQVSDNSST